jgi:hypothetical protein
MLRNRGRPGQLLRPWKRHREQARSYKEREFLWERGLPAMNDDAVSSEIKINH